MDTEDAKIEYVKIQGAEAMLVQKENVVQLVWAAKSDTALMVIIGEGTAVDDLLRVADELKY